MNQLANSLRRKLSLQNFKTSPLGYSTYNMGVGNIGFTAHHDSLERMDDNLELQRVKKSAEKTDKISPTSDL